MPAFRGGWSRRWRTSAPARSAEPRAPGPRRDIPRPYCLACYGALAAFEGARAHCARCGHLNLACDQGVFWTQEPRFVRLERCAKGLIAAAIGAMSWIILTRTSGFGTGQGFVVGAPILLGAYLWETAGKITRWSPELRAWIVWMVFLLVPGLLASALFVGLAFSGYLPRSLAPLALLGLVPAIAVPFLARSLDRWRIRRILRGAGIESARAA